MGSPEPDRGTRNAHEEPSCQTRPSHSPPPSPRPTSGPEATPAKDAASGPVEHAQSAPDDKAAEQPRPKPAAPERRAPREHPGGPSGGRGQPARTGGGSSNRVRARLARLGVQRSNPYNPVLEPLLRIVRSNDPKIETATLRQVEKAYQVAERWHRGQKRKSGDPYITHPLAVTTILAELGMDPATLMAGLLHDTVEDTEYGLDTLKRDFGDQVALLVDGVTKLDKVKFGEAAQAETVRKMVVAMAKDPRVLVIKLADRLHNMRTMRYLKREKQEKKARETLEIYAPLAHRLGMNTIKWELEDLAFAILYPKMYDEIVRLVAERAPKRDEYLAIVTDEVQSDLRAARIKATVTGRPKHYYSVYQKMIVRGRDFAEIYDLVGIRVLVDTVRDCYAALGTVHARWNPVPGRFKDYIAMPKFNMYQSLHTTVIGPNGKPVELQIRTFDMHRRAEYGIAAHWKYKQEPSAGASKVRTDAPKALRQGQGRRQRHGVAAPVARLAEGDRGPQRVPGVPALRPVPQRGLRLHAQGRRHSASGGRDPGGLRVRGPHGGRPPHHRRTGQRTPGPARIHPGQRRPGGGLHLQGGRRGPLPRLAGLREVPARPQQDPRLVLQGAPRRGDRAGQGRHRARHAQAEPADPAHPHRRLPGHARARDALPRHLVPVRGDRRGPCRRAERRAEAGAGPRRRGGGHRGDRRERPVAARGRGRKRRSNADPGVVVKGVDDVWVKLARCCTPVPGDPIIGFVTRGSGVSVHRTDCVNVDSLSREPERILEVEWAPTQSSVFLVAIQVEALDRSRLLSDVTRVLSDQHVNILSAAVQTSRDRVATSRFTFEMGDPKHLGHVLKAVRGVEGVYDVYRVTSARRP